MPVLELDEERRELEEAVHVEEVGIRPVRPEERDSTALNQFWIWAGANIQPLNWILGALGIVLGLSLIETIIVLVIGNVIGCGLFGLFAIMGHRTGVNQMVLSRLAWGRRGAFFPSFAQLLMTAGWVGLNTWVVLDLVNGGFQELGFDAGTGTKYLVGLGIMVIQVLLGIFGFYAIRTFEKYTVPVAAVIMVIMSILAWNHSGVTWNQSTVHGADKFTAITQLMTAIGIGWGIGWFAWASDYTRFVKPNVSTSKVFWSTSLGIFIPTVWLGALGASIASINSSADPSLLVATVFGAMTVPILFLIIHGPIATNVLNVYSCSMAAKSLDLKIERWKISLGAGVFASVVLVAFIQSTNFATNFDNWQVSLTVWFSPWAAITLVDFYILRRSRVDVAGLYESPTRSIYGDVSMAAMVAFALGLVAGWACEYGLVGALQGPIARAAGGVDFSWLAGGLVAGVVYYVMAAPRLRQVPVPETRPAA
jgi:NCS1 nucleoside transporter family